MDCQINRNQPTVMHIDLNSCFATVEQQANPLLRGKPLVVAAYNSPGGCIVSPSIEAKRLGIKVGMQVREARLISREVIVKEPDPAKYRDVHIKFSRIFRDYSPNVSPKSIDEAVIDFDKTPALKRGLDEIGMEIKQRMRKEIGEWISCNIGIGTNRFLAKLASGLHKPDGLDVINFRNLRKIYGQVSLVDLHGINSRFEARLNALGIYTPIDFLDSDLFTLQKGVFKSVVGLYWYYRIRGWEIDNIDFARKSFGQSYALAKKTGKKEELFPILMKLCEKMGRRLRASGYEARGIDVAIIYKDYSYWHMSKTFGSYFFTTSELYKKAVLIFNRQKEFGIVSKLSVSCFDLSKGSSDQLSLFDQERQKEKNLSEAMDKINDKYGEFSLVLARMMAMDNLILDRIAFGGVKELEEVYG